VGVFYISMLKCLLVLQYYQTLKLQSNFLIITPIVEQNRYIILLFFFIVLFVLNFVDWPLSSLFSLDDEVNCLSL